MALHFATDDLICATATAPAGGQRAIVRVAGPDIALCLEKCFTPSSAENQIPLQLAKTDGPRVIEGRMRLVGSARTLPCDFYYWPDQRSYTRSPMAEIHMIGSPPLVEAVLETLCECGARLAEPGEFTLRAFLGGRIDLTQAEAVLGVIEARGEQQLDVALRQLAGGLTGPLTDLREQLLEALAHLEAGLDFVEEDIEFISREVLLDQLDNAATQIAALAGQMQSRAESAPTVRAVLYGNPNVGKSSLFNALVKRDHAIVSETAGTTRDYLTATIEVNGVACELIDTAGWEAPKAADSIATAAQAKTTEQQQAAEVRLICLDSSRQINDCEIEMLCDNFDRESSVVVLTKCDLPRQSDLSSALSRQKEKQFDMPTVETSSATGTGLDTLSNVLSKIVTEATPADSAVVATTAARCRESLRQAAQFLNLARSAATDAIGEELVAAEIRAALNELGRVVGAVYTDDILDRIFSRFCIGK